MELEREREKDKAELEKERINLERERTVRPRVEEQRGPTPSHPKVQIPAWTPSTKPEEYFSNAERLFRSHKIPEDLWVSQLFSRLPDKARTVFSRLSEQEGRNP